MRRWGVTAFVLFAIALVGALPVQAATTFEGSNLLPYGDWAGGGPAAGIQHLGVTMQSFRTACTLDQSAIDNGTPGGFLDAWFSSPLNGLEATVFDLKTEKMGAFSVKGPGATPVGPQLPEVGQITSYDLDMDFLTAPDAAGGCLNANDVPSSSGKCYSTSSRPDESTPCIQGVKDDKGKKHGARYVVVVASLNLTGGPIPFKLTAP